jgi:hypothetical protein
LGKLQSGAAVNAHLDLRHAGKIVLARRSAEGRLLKFKSIARRSALVATSFALVLMLLTPSAEATPNFARQTGRPCNFCHRGVPRLNETGMAFKNNGFTFPETDKAPNKDRQDGPAQ